MGKDIKFTDGKISSKTGYDGDIANYQTTTPTSTKTDNEAGVKLVDSIQTEATSREICHDFEQDLEDYRAGKMSSSKRKRFLIAFRLLKRFLPEEHGGKPGENSATLCQADLEGNKNNVTDLCIAMMADDVSEGGRTVAHEKNEDVV